MTKQAAVFFCIIALLFPASLPAQECFFLKNVLDTLYQIDPATGFKLETAIPTDYPGQNFYGYLTTIDPGSRRYMYITLLSDTSFDDFGLKIIDLDNLQISSTLLSGYESVSPGIGQFSFQGMEYGAIADQLYLTPNQGDSLYTIDLSTGAMSAVQEIPNFGGPYAYLQTFYQSEQRYAMIGLDPNGQRRFYQIDLDDDTTYISPPMNFPEPLRALEVSDVSGIYYAISDIDQQFYEIDPFAGTLSPLFPVPAYQGSFGYLHTYDYSTEQFMIVALDTSNALRLFSIFPATNTVSNVPFPVPLAAYFGLEATNTQYIARMLNDLNSTEVEDDFDDYFQLYPNPAQSQIQLQMQTPMSLQLQLFNLAGNLVRQQEYPLGQSLTFDTRSLAPGTYLLYVQRQSRDQRWVKRIVITP